MIITIDDNVTPYKRRELLKTLPIKHAIEKFDSMKKASIFLGYSYRYVRETVKEYDYLRKIRDNSNIVTLITKENEE